MYLQQSLDSAFHLLYSTITGGPNPEVITQGHTIFQITLGH